MIKPLSGDIEKLISTKVVILLCKIYEIKSHNKDDKSAFSKIAMAANITFAHACKLLTLLIEENIVEKRKVDERASTVILTEKGKYIAIRLTEVCQILSDKEHKIETSS